MISVRPLKNKDYETLLLWWKENRFPPPGIDDLPVVDGFLQGFIVSYDNVDICAGFIIDTTVKNGAMLEYIVANFQIKDRELRKKSILFLIQTISDVCKKMGKKYLFTSLKSNGLKNSLLDGGFVIGSIDTCEMIKVL